MWLSKGFCHIHMIFQVLHWNVKRSVLNDVCSDILSTARPSQVLRHTAIYGPNSSQFSNKLPVQFPKYSFVSEWMPLKKKVEVDFCLSRQVDLLYFSSTLRMKGVSPLKVKTAVYLNCLVTPVCVTIKAVCLWKSLAIQTHLLFATKN